MRLNVPRWIAATISATGELPVPSPVKEFVLSPLAAIKPLPIQLH